MNNQPVSPVAEPDAPAARSHWQAWRAQREADLRRPHDWLSVAAFHWLRGTDQQVPGVPGRWTVAGHRLRVDFDTGQDVRLLHDGMPATTAASGLTTIELAEFGGTTFASFGRVVIEVVRRAGHYALRLRDPQAPTRTGFTEVPVFDYDPAWVVPARLQAFPEPRSRSVGSAAPGLDHVATTVGTVTVRIGGADHHLTATGRQDQWTLLFSDATSGRQTSAWRIVPVQRTGSDAGVVDFNRAVNMPFAFTDFGTCPAPVPDNHLTAAVRAGERAPHGRSGIPPAAGGPTALPQG